MTWGLTYLRVLSGNRGMNRKNKCSHRPLHTLKAGSFLWLTMEPHQYTFLVLKEKEVVNTRHEGSCSYRLRQGDHYFGASLCYSDRSCLKKKNNIEEAANYIDLLVNGQYLSTWDLRIPTFINAFHHLCCTYTAWTPWSLLRGLSSNLTLRQ